MKRVKFGVIGTGNMGCAHISYIVGSREAKLAAVCDIDESTASTIGAQYSVPWFTDHRKLINSGLVDAVIVATPHYFHVPISLDALKKDIHVLVEKPVAVTVGEADKLNRAAGKSRCKFSIMFQQRLAPRYQAARKIIDDKGLGKVYRVSMVIPWFRTQAYYDSGGWRATWKGEGGGLIINQLQHNLDILCWLVGLPQTVHGWTYTKQHKIEVEDEVCAVLEYADSVTAYIYASTFETPGNDRIEICGEKGKLLIAGENIRYWKIAQPTPVFVKKNKNTRASPVAREIKVCLNKNNPGHGGIIRNFVRAIQGKEKLIIPGEQGTRPLELGNAILLSSMQKSSVKLPLKRREVEELLARLRRKSKAKPRVRKSWTGERAPYLG